MSRCLVVRVCLPVGVEQCEESAPMCVFERRSRRSTRYCFVLVVNGRRRSLRASSILVDLVR